MIELIELLKFVSAMAGGGGFAAWLMRPKIAAEAGKLNAETTSVDIANDEAQSKLRLTLIQEIEEWRGQSQRDRQRLTVLENQAIDVQRELAECVKDRARLLLAGQDMESAGRKLKGES